MPEDNELQSKNIVVSLDVLPETDVEDNVQSKIDSAQTLFNAE